jgi:hypothetical protein
VKHLLSLPLIVVAMFLSVRADPIVTGQVHATGGFQASGGPANSPAAHPSAGQGNPSGLHPNGPGFSGNNGPHCATNPQCATPLIFINPGPNYQVISPSTTTVTPNSDATVVATPVIYVPVPASAPPVAVGTVDDKGYVHSPYSNSVLKIANPTNGQAVHDPTTGQIFYIQMSGTRLANQID